MNQEEMEKDELDSGQEEQAEQKPISALDAINASFNEKKLDAINASFNKKQQESQDREKDPSKKEHEPGNKDWIWNLVTGILVAVIVIVAIVILVTLWKGNRSEEQGALETQQQETVQAAPNSEPPEETEKISESKGTQDTRSSESETNSQTEETKKRESETQQTEKKQPVTEEQNQTNTGAETEIPTEYASILSADEQKEWKERKKDSNIIFVQINTKLKVSDPEKVYLRLINPPYSVFSISIRIYLNEDPENILYQSELMEPGTIQEYVSFSGSISPGSHPATVEYTVFDESGTKLGTHNADASIEAQ